MSVSILGLVLLFIAAVAISLPIVLLVVALGRKNKPAAVSQERPVTMADPAERNRQREAILEKLAGKELTCEEAEQQLLELDKPLPEQMPPPPPPTNKGCGFGCLIAAILGFMAFIVLLVLLYGFVGHRVRSVEQQHQAMQMEHMRHIEEMNR